MQPQEFKVGDLVEITSPAEYGFPDPIVGIVTHVINSTPNQAVQVLVSSKSKTWVTAYRLIKLS